MQNWKFFSRTTSGLCAILVLMLSLTACQAPAPFNPAFGMRFAEDSPGPGLTPATFDGKTVYLHAERVISADDIQSVKAGHDDFGPGGKIDFQFKAASTGRIGRLTEQSIGRTLCMTLGDEIISTATIRGVFAARMQTAGLESQRVAELLAKRITSDGG